MSVSSTQTPLDNNENSIFSGFFQSSIRNAKKRRILIVLFFFLLWSFFAVFLHPYQFPVWDEYSWNITTLTSILAAIPSWYFSLDVIFHLLFVFLGAILSYQITSRFFARIYGMKSGKTSDHFLLKIIFDLPREEPIIINNEPILGKYDEHLKVLGGPLKIIIGTENAAIFEKTDGSVQIVGPTLNLHGSYYQLESFEHLRDVFDLRNLKIHFDILARTKDGIPLMIKRVHAICSILRDSKKTTLTRPYSYNEQALYKFSYKKPSGIFVEKITEILKQEFIDYISHISFSDLFENVGDPEAQRHTNLENFEKSIRYNKKRKIVFSKLKHSFFQQLNLKKMLINKNGRNHKTNQYLMNADPQIINNSVQPAIEMKGNYSNQLLRNFMFDFKSRASKLGLNLEWVSFGSIDFPSKKVQSHFQQIWQVSSKNELFGSQAEFIRSKSNSENEEIDIIFNDVLKSEYSILDENTDERQNKSVLLKTLDFLNNCKDLYKNESGGKRSQFNRAVHELEKISNYDQDK
jgi:hypothetical protein